MVQNSTSAVLGAILNSVAKTLGKGKSKLCKHKARKEFISHSSHCIDFAGKTTATWNPIGSIETDLGFPQIQLPAGSGKKSKGRKKIHKWAPLTKL